MIVEPEDNFKQSPFANTAFQVARLEGFSPSASSESILIVITLIVVGETWGPPIRHQFANH